MEVPLCQTMKKEDNEDDPGSYDKIWKSVQLCVSASKEQEIF